MRNLTFLLLILTVTAFADSTQQPHFKKNVGFGCMSAKTKKRFRVVPANGEIFEYDKKGDYLSHVDLLEVIVRKSGDSKLLVRLQDPASHELEASLLLRSDGVIKMWFKYDNDSSIRCKKIKVDEY